MARNPEDSIPTRSSLLRRVKRWDDQTSWKEFYELYHRMLHGLALSSGLDQGESEDIVQEAFVELAQKLPTFEYDSARGSFKTWLLQLVKWRILDRLRKRARRRKIDAPKQDEGTATSSLARVADPAGVDFVTLWERQWHGRLMELSIENVRRTADAEKFQMFDLYVNQRCAPEQVAKVFGVKTSQVYLTKYRIAKMIRDEFKRLDEELDKNGTV